MKTIKNMNDLQKALMPTMAKMVDTLAEKSIWDIKFLSTRVLQQLWSSFISKDARFSVFGCESRT